MNRLVEEIIKPILEANGIKKVIGIYGGRFQPFGPHHYKTYKWLQSKVDEAYITTSNIKKPPRHPMNFKEKVRHMTKMGVKSKYIIEEKTPYVANNLSKKYDKDTTAFVYVFGAKDAGRLGGKYFQDYKKSKGNIKGFEQHGYYLVAPHVSISVGGKEVSGTTMRELLGSDKFDDKERKKLNFKKVEISSNISSQFISAILLVAPKLVGGLVIELKGKLISKPYVKMTLSLLNNLGIKTSFEGKLIKVANLEKIQEKCNYRGINIDFNLS